MRAILLASAIAASFGDDLRASSASSQGDARPRPRRACWITAVAPATSTLRNISSPARVIVPSRVLPAGREQARIWRLHDQRCGDDRPDPRNLRQTPAVGIGTVPSHQPGLDLL